MIGESLGHYRIEDEIGKGGMGIVYRALDTRLDRLVAVKFLSEELADLAARKRFQQEARTASSLNHPHILTVHDAGEFEGRHYIVMEFVDGGTLKDWAAAEKRSWRQIVELLSGVADGLATAQGAGILHCDIKPANILVTKNGYAKLADFGLAKRARGDGEDVTRTLTGSSGSAGLVMGTIAYMSPEQTEGKPLDSRSDIYSFGVVLYELLAGRRPFTGSELEIIQSIRHQNPPPLDESIPAGLRIAVEKALEKDPAERYQSMREMVVDLRRLARAPSETETALRVTAHRAPGRRRWLWSLPILALAGVGLWLAGVPAWLRGTSDFGDNLLAEARFSRLTDIEGNDMDAAISPDGNFIAFLSDRDGQFDVWLTRIGAGGPVNLTPGKDDERTPLRSLGFTPDGSEIWLAGVENRPIRLLPLVGGTPRVFLAANATAPAWSPDGSRVAYHLSAAGDPIYVADRSGANARRIFAGRSDDWHNHYVTWSADGRWIYFVHGTPASSEMDLWRIAPSGGQPERLTHHRSEIRDPTPLGRRRILYVAKDNGGAGPWLWSFDLERKRSQRISQGLEQYSSIAANRDGRRLVATVASPSVSLWSVPIVDGISQESDVKPLPVSSARAFGPRFSGRAVYYLSSRGAGDGLWRYQDGQNAEIWKGADGSLMEPPAISPDGRRIAIVLRQEGKRRLHVISADGAELQPIATEIDVQGSSAWSPDGNWIVTGGNDGKGEGLFKIAIGGGAAARLASRIGRNPVWSPDGSLIVYAGPNVFTQTPLLAVRPDGSPVELPPIRVHRNWEGIRFTPDGRLIYLLGSGASPTGDFWLLDLATRTSRQLTRFNLGFTMRSFDVTPDGKQIVFDRFRENSDVVLIDLPRQP